MEEKAGKKRNHCELGIVTAGVLLLSVFLGTGFLCGGGKISESEYGKEDQETGETKSVVQETQMREKVSIIQETQTEEKTSVQWLMDVAGCSRSGAEQIMRTLDSLKIGELTGAAKIEGTKDLSVCVTDESGKAYELGIDKQGELYAVKDVEQERYLFAVYE